MSTNESAAAIAQVNDAVPTAPPGYGLWFTSAYNDIAVDDTIAHRKELIEAYYAGYTSSYNIVKGTSYSVEYGWSESPSEQDNCLCFSLHVFVTPPPTILTKASNPDLAAEGFALRGGGDGDDGDDGDGIDPPRPPMPPPPTM